MFTEVHHGSAKAPGDAAASAHLSDHVFSNPADFLQVLKLDFDKIAPGGQDSLSKHDLLQYAAHGTDPRGRAAATIAAEHFQQLQQIPGRVPGIKHSKGTGISRNDLSLDTDVVNGDTGSIADSIFNKHHNETVVPALVIGFGLPGAAVNIRNAPLALGLLGVSIAAGAVIAKWDIDARHSVERLSAETVNDQNMIHSWI